jgi:hypothetical protein
LGDIYLTTKLASLRVEVCTTFFCQKKKVCTTFIKIIYAIFLGQYGTSNTPPHVQNWTSWNVKSLILY